MRKIAEFGASNGVQPTSFIDPDIIFLTGPTTEVLTSKLVKLRHEKFPNRLNRGCF